MKKKSLTCFAIGLFLLAAALSVGAQSSRSQGRNYGKLKVGRTAEFQDPVYIARNGVPKYIDDDDDLKPGDVVGVGTRLSNGACQLPNVFVTNWPENGKSKGTVFRQLPNCNLIVSQKFNVSIQRKQAQRAYFEDHGPIALVASLSIGSLAGARKVMLQTGWQTTRQTVDVSTYILGSLSNLVTQRISNGAYSRYWSPGWSNCSVTLNSYGHTSEANPGSALGAFAIDSPQHGGINGNQADIHTPVNQPIQNNCQDDPAAFTYGRTFFHFAGVSADNGCPEDFSYPGTSCYHNILAGGEVSFRGAQANTVNLVGTIPNFGASGWTYTSIVCDSYYGDDYRC